tara:strand:+ start:173369 stop:173830 length:462 start_codon:yes stop_codon:yes gene_type:complete
MEKRCTTCKLPKDTGEFNKNKAKKDGLNTICRECSNKHSKQYYQENKEHHIKVISKRRNITNRENRKKLFNFYLNNPCVDCTESDPIVLECDHKEGVVKFKIVSEMVNSGYSWDRIQEEIDKCDVRCSNCHKKRTAKDQGWYKDLICSGGVNG